MGSARSGARLTEHAVGGPRASQCAHARRASAQAGWTAARRCERQRVGGRRPREPRRADGRERTVPSGRAAPRAGVLRRGAQGRIRDADAPGSRERDGFRRHGGRLQDGALGTVTLGGSCGGVTATSGARAGPDLREAGGERVHARCVVRIRERAHGRRLRRSSACARRHPRHCGDPGSRREHVVHDRRARRRPEPRDVERRRRRPCRDARRRSAARVDVGVRSHRGEERGPLGVDHPRCELRSEPPAAADLRRARPPRRPTASRPRSVSAPPLPS